MVDLKWILIPAILFAALTAQEANVTAPLKIDSTVIEGHINPGSCPPSHVLESARNNMSASIEQLLQLSLWWS